MATGFFERLDDARMWETRLLWHFVGLGMHVIPAYTMDDNKTRKPAIYGPLAAVYTLPDLLTFSGGRGMWYEVKAKRNCFYSGALQAYATGFDAPLFEEYRQVQQITGMSVRVVFIHEHEAQVRYIALDALQPTTHNGKCLWRWDDLRRAAVTPHELTAWDSIGGMG